MQRARMQLFVLAAVVLTAASGLAQPALTVINSSPLKINVAADGSFQIYNTAVPGTGQVFPSGCEDADMGVFAFIDGKLYAPNFAAHPCGTATGNLGTYTPWTQRALSSVPSGDGTPESPYTVGLSLGAADTDVRVNVIVTHVRGDNFFRVRTQFFATQPHRIDALLGADIYLAASDNGIFLTVPELDAVGGRDCGIPATYNILLIPITPAARFTASEYSNVWAQIAANALDNQGGEAGCIDNGAAVEWVDIMRNATPTAGVELTTAVSFGEIPSVASFQPFSVSVTPNFVTLSPGETAKLTITSTRNAELGFNAPITFSAPDLPPGVTLTFDQSTVAAPGNGTVTATLRVDSDVFPQVYRGLGIIGTGGGESHAARFGVDVLCNPPFILGLSQPQSVTVKQGTKTTLRVKAENSGGAVYQWYNGYAPLTGSPIADSNKSELEVGPINDTQYYWVRVTNPCGTTDSQTVVVTPTR